MSKNLTMEHIREIHREYVATREYWSSVDTDCWYEFCLFLKNQGSSLEKLSDKAMSDYIAHGSMMIEVSMNPDPKNPDTLLLRNIPWTEFVKK